MHEDILKELYKPFVLKARKGAGGKVFNYVPSDDIVDRMNTVFKGNWTTEVLEAKIIEDQVLIRVRVSAMDEGVFYHHEGYASQPIARYTFGDNEGKVIDIGNSYKSAMSKAIKTAVAKWGVALYLTEKEASAVPTAPASSQSWNPQDAYTVDKAPPLNVPIVNVPSGPPMPNPPAPNPQVNKVFTDTNVVEPPATPPATGFTPPSQEMLQVENEYVTSVQKVAIETIMSVHNMDFNTLVAKALGRTEDLPELIDKVKYQDAVKLIQYGNNIQAVQ